MNVSKSVAIFKAVKLIRNLNQLGSQWFGIVTTLQFPVLKWFARESTTICRWTKSLKWTNDKNESEEAMNKRTCNKASGKDGILAELLENTG